MQFLNDDFLARPREDAEYGDFETFELPEEELVKIKFISRFRDPESNLRLLDSIKSKPAKSIG